MTSDYSFTKSRILQWLGILFSLGLIAVGYWYFSVYAGYKTNTSLTDSMTTGLAGYWRLDDGSGSSATDSSTNGSTGTLNNMEVGDWTTGQMDGALDFDGSNEYISIPDANHLDITGTVTLSAWIRSDSYPATGDYDSIIVKGNAGTPAINYGMETYGQSSTQYLTFFFHNGSSQIIRGSTGLTTGVWHHVAVVYNDAANDIRLYVNGAQESETVITGSPETTSIITNSVQTEIGSYNSDRHWFDGRIDEVRVYNRAFSGDEVVQLYRLTTPTGIDTGLKGYWSFNGADTTGTTTYDRSGAGNNGTLTNGPTITTGKVGQALTFDGSNDYVSTGSGVPTADIFTFTAWVKWNSGTSTIIGPDTDAGIQFRVMTSTGRIELLHSNTLSIGNSTVGVPAGIWTHVAVTNDASGNYRFYINGTDAGGSGTNLFNYANRPVLIGTRTTSTLESFNGSIDEVRIYNTALTAAQIQSIYRQEASDEVNTSASQPQGTGRLDSGLALYWRFDEGSGSTAADSSGNALDGTASGGPTWTTGQIGTAAYFDGTSRFTNSSSGSIALNPTDGESFAIAGWFNRDTFTTDDTVVAKRTGLANTDDGYIAYIDDATDKLTFEVSDEVDEYQLESVSTFTATGWHHFVVSWNDVSGATLYINGIPEAATVTGTFSSINDLTASVAFAVGADSLATRLFNGAIDEIRIYTQPLSADQVAQLYRLTTPTGVDTGLKGYWSFNGNDVSGTTAFDRSGRGDNGTLTNSPAVAPGRIGQGLAFASGSSNVVLTSSTSTTAFGTGDFSFGAWVKTTGFVNQGSSANTIIAREYTGVANGYGIGYNSTNTPYCNVSTDGFTTGGSPLNDGRWHFVMLVRRSNVVECWQNGTKLTDSSTTANISSTARLYFGNDSAGPYNRSVVGSVDEVRLYNRALTASEIQSLYKQGQSDEVNTSASQPQGTGRLDSGLAGYWALDENTGTNAGDSSTVNNAGTLQNTPTWTTGQIGSALDFDEASLEYVSIADNPAQDVADGESFSLSGWFNRDTFTTDDPVFDKRGSLAAGSAGYIVYIDDATDKLTFEVSDGTDEYQLESVSTFTATGWNHYAIVWNDNSSTETRMYINGANEPATATGTFGNVNSLTSSATTNLAYGGLSFFQFFDGKLDELRLYKRALSADEVSELYRLTSPTGTDTSLKGYWSFNGKDLSGTSAYDRSGAGNTGTLTNGPTVTPGKLGQALNFDGSNDHVDITNIVYSGEVTLATWFYTTNNSQTGIIFGDNNGTSSGGQKIGISSGNFTVRAISGGSNDISVAVPTAGQWHHLVITRNSANKVDLYINGGSATRLFSDAAQSGSNTLDKLGCNGGDASQCFSGRLDETRIYNRALSVSEVAALYAAGR